MIITRTPFRITLGGGGTDLPSFYKDHGGFVLTMSIDKYIYVTLKPSLLEKNIRLQYKQSENVASSKHLVHDRARTALLLHDIHKAMEISSIGDLPSQSGLGSSGSYLVGLLHALRSYKRISVEPSVVAEEACKIEIGMLKEPVGKQDQYIAAHGGIKILDISRDGDVFVSAPPVSISAMREFLSNVHIYYTGVLRSASDILSEQNKATVNVVENLKKIKDLGYQFVDAVQTQNFDEFGLLLDEHWNFKKKLSNKISFPQIDKLYKEVKKDFGVLGGKIIGAGGGGFIMLYCPKKHLELEQYMENLGFPRLHYFVDYEGSKNVAEFGSFRSQHFDHSK